MAAPTKTIRTRELAFVEKIEHGAYGEVWKANWKKSGKTIPVEVTKLPVIGQTETQRKCIIDEINNNLSKIQHPNILQLFGALAVRLEVWVVSEFMEGKSLFHFLQSENSIPWEVRLRLAHKAACAVQALHSSNPVILHRDIKSSNFLVSTDYSAVKLRNFGLSKVVTVVSAVPRALEMPRWGAPETLDYPPKWSQGADIYSLGITFYEIATREIPFGEVDDTQLKLMAQGSERPNLPEECPEEFANIIRACWTSDPQTRPNSQQVLQMLEAVVVYETPDNLHTYYENKTKEKQRTRLIKKVKTSLLSVSRTLIYAEKLYKK